MQNNNLGGDMPQSRLDAIKFAWMNRFGTTEEEWNTFKQQNTYTPNASEGRARNGHEFDSIDDIANKMEFPFCPDWREMGFRYRTKADYFRRLAEKEANTNPVQAAGYRAESRFWRALSQSNFKQAEDNRRKL